MKLCNQRSLLRSSHTAVIETCQHWEVHPPFNKLQSNMQIPITRETKQRSAKARAQLKLKPIKHKHIMMIDDFGTITYSLRRHDPNSWVSLHLSKMNTGHMAERNSWLTSTFLNWNNKKHVEQIKQRMQPSETKRHLEKLFKLRLISVSDIVMKPALGRVLWTAVDGIVYLNFSEQRGTHRVPWNECTDDHLSFVTVHFLVWKTTCDKRSDETWWNTDKIQTKI